MSHGAPGSDGRDELYGAVIDDKYVVGTVIGQGRAGNVYEGRTRADGIAVAIKVLRPTLSRSRMHVDRFLESARMTAAVGHPGVVRVLDVGQVPGHSVYVAMEWLTGVDLRRLLRERGPLPWSRVRGIALDVCAALSAAHGREIVHGALDPSRCFVLPPDPATGREAVALVDFGIAGEGSGPEIWPAAAAFRPPERRQGEPASARGDVFAVAALVFEMLAGRAPKPGESLLAEGVQVDAQIDEVVTKALSRDPSRRFRGAAALEEALAAVDALGRSLGRPVPAITGTTQKPASARPRRHEPLDEEDITTVRPDRRAPSVPPMPAASVSRPASAPRPSPHEPEDPTPPPMITPLAGASLAAAPPRTHARALEPEPEDRTSLLGGGFRLPAQEQTSILRMPEAPPTTPASAERPATPATPDGATPDRVDEGHEHTMVVEFRPPGAGRQTGLHAITNRPPGVPREETAILSTTDIGRPDLAPATAGLVDDPAVMREQTQVLGMDLRDADGDGDPSISMTAVIEAPLGERGISGAIVTTESPVPDFDALSGFVASPIGSRVTLVGTSSPEAGPGAGAHTVRPVHPPVSGGHPPVSGGHPPVSGGHPPATGGYPPVSGGHPPATGGYPPMSGPYPASRPPQPHGAIASNPGAPRSGASIAVPSSHPGGTRSRDRGMVFGVALGVLIAVAILGGGAIAGLWIASK